MLCRRGSQVASFYTPHGGSLHFDPKSLEGRVYHTLEKVLARFTDGLIFESQFAKRVYGERIGLKDLAVRVIPNGLQPGDFQPHQPVQDADDFLFIGELRHLKGVDVMLHALARLNQSAETPAAETPARPRAQQPRPVRATFIGGGPDVRTFQDLAARLSLQSVTSFPGPQPAAQAFQRGRCLVVPSRAESFPYIVLEAGAASMPIIATDVGGIPEMTHGTAVNLIPPSDVSALAEAMALYLADPAVAAHNVQSLNVKIAATYTVAAMTDAIVDFYAEAGRKSPDK